jgi:hypothetical protein
MYHSYVSVRWQGDTCRKLTQVRRTFAEGFLYSLLRLRQLSLDPRLHGRYTLCDPCCTPPGLHREPHAFPCRPKRDFEGAALARLLEMPMLGARIGAQSSSHTNLQSVMCSRFLDQGGELFLPSCGIDSYFHLFHTVTNSNVMVPRALAQPLAGSSDRLYNQEQSGMWSAEVRG